MSILTFVALTANVFRPLQPNQQFRSLGRRSARKARKVSNRVSLALLAPKDSPCARVPVSLRAGLRGYAYMSIRLHVLSMDD